METFISFFDQFSNAFFILALCFIVFDIITGYLQAIANKCVDSTKMRQGFWHKLALILALFLAALIDTAISFEPLIGTQLGLNAPIFEGACIFVSVMEITSILENIKKINPNLNNAKVFGMLGSAKEIPEVKIEEFKVNKVDNSDEEKEE